MSEFVYLDHSATTPTDPRVVAKMMPYWTEQFGNPSSLHEAGRAAKEALEDSRQKISRVVNCQEDEIIFTSGGTESNNLALRGVAHAMRKRGRGNHLITTATEHHAVLEVMQELAEEGFELTILPVNRYGQVTAEQVQAALREDTILVSVIYANNEVGSINPIAEIGAILKPHQARFHVDAVQAAGLLPLNVQALQVDLLSLSAHKFYGPKGIGLLYSRRVTPLQPQILGGGQQQHRRSGTEPIPLIVGLAEALCLAEEEREASVEHLTQLRNHLIAGLHALLPTAELTGHPTERLAGHSSFVLEHLNGDAILLDLNELGFGASGGSACTTGQQEPSHVLQAMAVDEERLMGQVRFVLGKSNTKAQVDAFLYQLGQVIQRNRVF
jgi:cysteine desulfurase